MFFLATVQFSLHSDEIRREYASCVEKYSISFSKRPPILLCSLGSRQKTLSRPTIEERVTKNTGDPEPWQLHRLRFIKSRPERETKLASGGKVEQPD